jgi:hypothetical protein
MAYPTRSTSSYALTSLNTGVLLKEDGFALLTESGNEILLENPVNDPNLSSRSVSSFNSNPVRN